MIKLIAIDAKVKGLLDAKKEIRLLTQFLIAYTS